MFNGLVTGGLILMVLVNFYFRLGQIWEVIVKGRGRKKRSKPLLIIFYCEVSQN